MSFVITTETTSDIPETETKKYGIGIVPVHLQISRESDRITTSAPNPFEYDRFFRGYTDRGIGILHISLSEKLSSAYRNAVLAAENNPLVTVFDSGNISAGSALMCILCAKKAQEEADPSSVKKYGESITEKIESGYVLNSTGQLVKSGRLKSPGVYESKILSIKPSVNIKDGMLCPGRKYTGQLEKAAEAFIKEKLSAVSAEKGVCLIMSDSKNKTEAEKLKGHIREEYGFREVVTGFFGDTVEAFCGSGCMGMAFLRQ